MPSLTGPEIQTIVEALLDAFNQQEMEELLRFHLDKRLNQIAGPNDNLRVIMREIVETAERQGWTDKFLAAVREERPDFDSRLHVSRLHVSRFTIPSPVADFTGRAGELDVLVAHLSPVGTSARIAGVRGMGGVGKTQLAYAVAGQLRAQYPDAALLVEMQAGDIPVTPEAALGRVLLAFFPGAKLPDALTDLQALYRSELGGKRGLLLLDNAIGPEHVAPLLPPPVGWAAIVTSREKFGLRDAPKLVNLDVLPAGEAVTLLRTMLADGGRADAAAEDAGLVALAESCGRLPLALRVAAGYLCSYTDETLQSYTDALRGEGNALGNLGLAYAILWDARRAITYYEQHLVITREIGDRRGEGNALGNLGSAYAALGDARRAIEYHEQALVIDREIGDRRGEAIGSWNLGLLYESQGDTARAAVLMQVCVDFEREAGHADAEKDAAELEEVRRKAEEVPGGI